MEEQGIILERATFEFSQDGNCISDSDQYEYLTVVTSFSDQDWSLLTGDYKYASADNLFSSKLNNITVTAPASTATLTLANNSTLATVGGFSLTLNTTDVSSVTFPTAGILITTGNKLSIRRPTRKI